MSAVEKSRKTVCDMSVRARTISSAEMTAHAGYTPDSELNWTKAAKRLQAAAKGSTLAGFLPIDGGPPAFAESVEGLHYTVSDPLAQDYEPRITYNHFARPSGYAHTDPFERAEDRAAELVVSAPGRNGKVEL